MRLHTTKGIQYTLYVLVLLFNTCIYYTLTSAGGELVMSLLNRLFPSLPNTKLYWLHGHIKKKSCLESQRPGNEGTCMRNDGITGWHDNDIMSPTHCAHCAILAD